MRKYTILLVDDDPLILKGVGKYLEKRGYRITTTDNGEKAIELLEDAPFDLVITDLVMGHINGIQVLKESKRLNPDVMNIILTGHGDMVSTIDALRLDADDYLLKPCTNEELDYRIASCLEKLALKLKVKRAEEEIRKAKNLESLGVLSGGIAHDFNNLLSIILGNLSLLKYDIKLDLEGSEYLQEAENASLRAKELTTRLITFSKGGDPVKKVMSIGTFVKESVQSALGGFGMDCEISVPDDLFPVEIDESQMKLVIGNIVINAQEAMDGKGVIRVYCANVTVGDRDPLQIEEGKYVKISIEDQGVGIAEENLGKIFDPYFSTKETGMEKGMGLGLSVCHSIVEKHNGLITVASELGTGTTFTLCLPASDKVITKPKSPEEDLLKEPISGSGKLLVMDDERMIRKLAINRLSRLGYDVEVAGDGAESIELYEKARDAGKPFDVVILDLTIKSGMGGKETIQILREIDPDVKGIVATGYSNDPVVANCREYGFKDALTKPYSTYELSKVLHDVISEE